MDLIVGELIVIPILLPISFLFQVALIHLGMITTLNFMIGLSTPPYGESLFIVSATVKVPLGVLLEKYGRLLLF